MKLATTTTDFGQQCKTYLERVEQLYAAGFRYIDLGFEYHAEDELLVGPDWRENVAVLKAYADAHGMKFVQSHGPCNGTPTVKDERYPKLVEATKRSIEICSMLGIPNIVVHAGPAKDKETFFEVNREFFLELLPTAEKFNVEILHENSAKANMGALYWTNTGAEMLEFVQYVNHPLLHAVWDTGHANMEGRQYEHILALGKELHALHVHDNRGERDEHLIPYLGTLNWDELMHALIDVEYHGYFTMEACSSLRPSKYWHGDRKAYPQDERLKEPTVEMQQLAEKMLYGVAWQMLSAYGLQEE